MRGPTSYPSRDVCWPDNTTYPQQNSVPCHELTLCRRSSHVPLLPASRVPATSHPSSFLFTPNADEREVWASVHGVHGLPAGCASPQLGYYEGSPGGPHRRVRQPRCNALTGQTLVVTFSSRQKHRGTDSGHIIFHPEDNPCPLLLADGWSLVDL